MTYQGPIRLMLVNKRLHRQLPGDRSFRSTGWMIATAAPVVGDEGRWVLLRHDPRHDLSEVFACDFENALMTLQYLVDNPTIRSI